MAQEAKQEAKEAVGPEQCWKTIGKRKNPPINYYILDLNGNKTTVKSQGVATGMDQVMSETAGGNLVYLRVDQHEEGAYDEAVIKYKFVRIQVNPDGINAVKLIQYNNKANKYNSKKAVHFTDMIKAASAEDVDLEMVVVKGKFNKSAHAKNSTFKFGEDEFTSEK